MLSPGSAYAASDKSALDESVRYLEAPKDGEAFGLLQEKRFRCSFNAEERYDDNIYLTKDATIDDFITTLSPSATFYYGNSDSLFYTSYNADIFLYGKKNKENRINQAVEARMELARNGRIKFRFSDTFRPTSDPATSETNDFVKRIANGFDATMRWDASEKTSLELSYDQVLQHYINESYRDYSYFEHRFSPILYWHNSPKLSFTGEYNLGIIDYYEGLNYSSIFQQARAGVQGKLTAKSTVYLKAGYQYRYYESTARKNTQGAVAEAVYDYLLSQKTTVQILASYDINESVYEDVGYFKSANAYLSVNHDISNNLVARGSVFYVRSDYPQETVTSTGEIKKRTDNLLGFNVRATYDIKSWLAAYVEYQYKFKVSNFRDIEYGNSRVSGGAKLSF
ncbi:MAG: outer membrane beta-barrel protein [Candidatus Omnitrophota bacterium]|nr:outer membrane beta-barrel protein [Candidatus Omnitrophota bacterium]